MKSKSAFVAMLGVFVVGCAIWMAQNGREQRSDSAMQPSMQAGSIAPTARYRDWSAPSKGMPNSTKMYNERAQSIGWDDYGQAADFKKFYDANRSKAESERSASYYLYNLLRGCLKLVAGGRVQARDRILKGKYPKEVEAMREATLDGLWSKCSGFEIMSPAEVDAEYVELQRLGEKVGNLQFAARSLTNVDRAKTPTFASDLVALLETRDPAVLWELAPVAHQLPELRNIAGNIGVPSPVVLTEAWAMAACDAGYDCHHLVLPGFCLDKGVCSPIDYADALRQSAFSPTDFEMANLIRLRIGETIRNKDWQAFGLSVRK